MKIFFASLGCDKNLVDSEKMLGILGKEGYTFTDDETQAEIIIVNTCCFIGDAKEESIQTILDLAQQKETGKCQALIVTGGLAERYQKELMEELPKRFNDIIVASSVIDNVEINEIHANKGEALCALADHLGVSREATLDFGDGLNDLTMIKYAGVGVAMGNAQQPVKDAADVITLSNDEDGLVPIIEKYILHA